MTSGPWAKSGLAAPLLMIGWAACAAGPGQAPSTLMEAVAGRVYLRTVHDAGGEIVEVSRLGVGVLRRLEDGRVAVPVELTSRSPGGDWSPTSRFRWICEPEATDMLMSVFAAGSRRESSEPRDGWRFAVEGPAVRYPARASPGTVLDDVVLRLRTGEGMASLFRKRIVVRLVDRRVRADQTAVDGSGYVIESDVDATAYWFGVPARRWQFRSVEWVRPGVGLVRQRVTFEDGGHATVEVLRDGQAGAKTERSSEVVP